MKSALISQKSWKSVDWILQHSDVLLWQQFDRPFWRLRSRSNATSEIIKCFSNKPQDYLRWDSSHPSNEIFWCVVVFFYLNYINIKDKKKKIQMNSEINVHLQQTLEWFKMRFGEIFWCLQTIKNMDRIKMELKFK